jgi:Flp pilus assembly protein TadG
MHCDRCSFDPAVQEHSTAVNAISIDFAAGCRTPQIFIIQKDRPVMMPAGKGECHCFGSVGIMMMWSAMPGRVKTWLAWMRPATRRFGSSRQGHAGMMFAVLALPLIMAIGFVIDFTQANRYKTELQNVADAVALAAVRGLPISDATGRNDGRSLYEALMRQIRAGLLTDELTITFETEPDYKALVTINATAKGTFGNNIGMGPITFEVKAQAVLGRSSVEVAMVLDLSASMVTSRMKALGAAMTTFDRTILENAETLDRFRLAVVPFSQSVTLPRFAASWLDDPKQRDLANASLDRVCFEPVSTREDSSIATPDGLTGKLLVNYNRCMSEQTIPLMADMTRFRAMATAFKNPPAWRQTWRGTENTPYWGTALYLGSSWANRLLNASWAPFLPGGMGAESANKATKFAIIMTDGDQIEIDAYTRAQADGMLLATCNSMRATNVEVFTIGFSLTPAGKTLLRRCADRDENFIAADNEADLVKAFERVARTIGEARARLVF